MPSVNIHFFKRLVVKIHGLLKVVLVFFVTSIKFLAAKTEPNVQSANVESVFKSVNGKKFFTAVTAHFAQRVKFERTTAAQISSVGLHAHACTTSSVFWPDSTSIRNLSLQEWRVEWMKISKRKCPEVLMQTDEFLNGTVQRSNILSLEIQFFLLCFPQRVSILQAISPRNEVALANFGR